MKKEIAFSKAALMLSLFTIIPVHASDVYVITASAARFRSEISLKDDATRITSIPKNTKITVLSKKSVPGKGTWLQVKIGKKTGWINSHLAKANSGAAPAS